MLDNGLLNNPMIGVGVFDVGLWSAGGNLTRIFRPLFYTSSAVGINHKLQRALSLQQSRRHLCPSDADELRGSVDAALKLGLACEFAVDVVGTSFDSNDGHDIRILPVLIALTESDSEPSEAAASSST